MSRNSCLPQTALKFEAQVQAQGRVEVVVPFSPGARVVVLVFEEPTEACDDLIAAAQSTLDFWDNPYDDADWNDA